MHLFHTLREVEEGGQVPSQFYRCMLVVVLGTGSSCLALGQSLETPASSGIEQYPSTENQDVQGPFWGTERQPKRAAKPAGFMGTDASRYIFAGGLTANKDSTAVNLSVSQRRGDFFRVTWQGHYQHQVIEVDAVNYRSQKYGARFLWEFWLNNPTMVIPIAGVGPGVEYWQQTRESELFDRSSAVSGQSFYGFALRLTRRFGLQVRKVTNRYLTTPPEYKLDANRSVNTTSSTTQVYFTFWF